MGLFFLPILLIHFVIVIFAITRCYKILINSEKKIRVIFSIFFSSITIATIYLFVFCLMRYNTKQYHFQILADFLYGWLTLAIFFISFYSFALANHHNDDRYYILGISTMFTPLISWFLFGRIHEFLLETFKISTHYWYHKANKSFHWISQTAAKPVNSTLFFQNL